MFDTDDNVLIDTIARSSFSAHKVKTRKHTHDIYYESIRKAKVLKRKRRRSPPINQFLSQVEEGRRKFFFRNIRFGSNGWKAGVRQEKKLNEKNFDRKWGRRSFLCCWVIIECVEKKRKDFVFVNADRSKDDFCLEAFWCVRKLTMRRHETWNLLWPREPVKP